MQMYHRNVEVSFETGEKEIIKNCIELLCRIINDMKTFNITELYDDNDNFINIREIKDISEHLSLLLGCNEGS